MHVRRTSNLSMARAAGRLALLVGLVAASGASCPQMVQQYTQPIPRALPAAATLQQVLDVVNDNTSRIQSFSTTRASISTPGFPALRANIAYERQKRFRLRGDTVLTGTEVDLGSNDELFWFWIRRNQPPAIYFCRHDQFAGSQARKMLPLEPQWLVESLGVIAFDPQDSHQGPFPVGTGRLEIRTTELRSRDPLTRITIIDESKGIILQQNIYDQQGRPLATAQLSGHVRDPLSGAILPRHVDVQWPPASFELSIDLGDIQFNHLEGNPQELWTKPEISGFQNVDLANANLQPAPAPPTAQRPYRPPNAPARY